MFMCVIDVEQIVCAPTRTPDCEGAGTGAGHWCCVDHQHAADTGHVLVLFKWELAGKLSFSVFQEKYDNKIETHEIFNSPLSIRVAPSPLSAAGCTIERFGGGGPVMPSLPLLAATYFRVSVAASRALGAERCLGGCDVLCFCSHARWCAGDVFRVRPNSGDCWG